uniref:Uncharacterized protein n=2 Tax=Anguilla anguilla TaxID=7936 RepID=A0A0E9T7X0_ANGAN
MQDLTQVLCLCAIMATQPIKSHPNTLKKTCNIYN